MQTIDIGVIFDISSPMQYIFSLFDEGNFMFEGPQILDILQKICLRGNISKNDQIRLFSIISGENKKAYDLCQLFELINKNFVNNSVQN